MDSSFFKERCEVSLTILQTVSLNKERIKFVKIKKMRYFLEARNESGKRGVV